LYGSASNGTASNGTASNGTASNGTASNGTLSFHDIKLTGGMIIAQDPASTTYNQMPINAINTGLVDVIAQPKNMPILLAEFSNHPYSQSKAEQTDQQVFNCIYSILSLLHSRTGYDFSGYRKNMLFRCIQRRMCVSYRNNTRLSSVYEK
jgi:two-component system CheB/CheR fusion protein